MDLKKREGSGLVFCLQFFKSIKPAKKLTGFWYFRKNELSILKRQKARPDPHPRMTPFLEISLTGIIQFRVIQLNVFSECIHRFNPSGCHF